MPRLFKWDIKMLKFENYYDAHYILCKVLEKQNVKECLIKYIDWLSNNEDVICSNPDHKQKAKEIFGEDIFKGVRK